ncbi:hypothetical protein [Xanthobacter aminoxidans]|uniref:hypothetical protein n=1 Tax=Xanthobacter aminoxidans TaxID=186280 RepID=UPI00202318EA|nr:hypothetical protein [Xanthobacter aminoxidans]MCL8385797.1 hypothetical protein [Xanthobacter aminoxidans]
MFSRRLILSFLTLPGAYSAANADGKPSLPAALIVRPRMPSGPLSAQLDALAPLAYVAELGLGLQKAWSLFPADLETRMGSTLAWAEDASARPGFVEVHKNTLRAYRRSGAEAALRLASQDRAGQEVGAARASINFIFARERHDR